MSSEDSAVNINNKRFLSKHIEVFSMIGVLVMIIVGVFITLLGFLPLKPFTSHVIMIFGIMIAFSPIIGFAVKLGMHSVENKIEKEVKGHDIKIAGQIKSFEGEIMRRMDWEWLNKDDNWAYARELIGLIERDCIECYETSSIANNGDYENAIKDLAKAWRNKAPDDGVKFVRIFCFDEFSNDKQSRDCSSLFHRILNPSPEVGGKEYEDLRTGIRLGYIRMLHLPFRLLTDYLVLHDNQNKYKCLFSLALPDKENIAQGKILDSMISQDFHRHLVHIQALAARYCEEHYTVMNGKACKKYCYSSDHKTLFPKSIS